jgi:hypothetical protein
LVSIFLSTTRLSCPATMKPTLPALFFLPLILLGSVECDFDKSCATLSNNTLQGHTSSLNRRSPFIADSFPDEASVNLIKGIGGMLTFTEPDPKVYGITLTRKGRGPITTVALKGWIHVVFNLPIHNFHKNRVSFVSTISYLHK